MVLPCAGATGTALLDGAVTELVVVAVVVVVAVAFDDDEFATGSLEEQAASTKAATMIKVKAGVRMDFSV